MYRSPREMFLEAENHALRAELEVYKARAGEFKTMLQSAPPETMHLPHRPPQVTLNLVAKGDVYSSDTHPGWHVVVRALPNGSGLEQLRVGYYISDNLLTIKAADQIAAMSVALREMQRHLEATAKRVEKAGITDRWPERFFEQ